VRKADNLPPSCAVVTKSGNLNFLEPPGPFQACNETALPLPLPFTNISIYGIDFYPVSVLESPIFCKVKTSAIWQSVILIEKGKVHSITDHEGPERE